MPTNAVSYQLAYLDLGLVSIVPESVRDGLVCAVVLLVERRLDDVAELFVDLMLLPKKVLDDPLECVAFKKALDELASTVLNFDNDDFNDDFESSRRENGETATTTTTAAAAAAAASEAGVRRDAGAAAAAGGVVVVPSLRFDALLSGLLALAPRFEFQLPPYFVNNARALGTLEGDDSKTTVFATKT
jgi:predicted unusual protein kinase regulating ubiquinone biosynthesis (AarF/ABC1/UbiB family)